MVRCSPHRSVMCLCASVHMVPAMVLLGGVSILEVVPAEPRQAERPDQHPHISSLRQETLLTPPDGMVSLLLQLKAPVDGSHAIWGLPDSHFQVHRQ